jgi:1,2-dihydroxy-3-keto-5-methylthiopentene dioxygenase
MSLLSIYPEKQPEQAEHHTDYPTIHRQLDQIGVQFERWTANSALSDAAEQAAVLAAYAEPIERLMQQYGFQAVDVISLTPDHPNKAELRQKFLAEHTHSDFEVRFFVEGSGLFYLHVNSKVYAVLCQKGDLISVPTNTTHWFDMGTNPHFVAIRLFTTPEGWLADFTGSDIAQHFPTYDQTVAELA